jgi:hypothetical protein
MSIQMATVAGLSFSTQTGRLRGIALPSLQAIGSVADVFSNIDKCEINGNSPIRGLSTKVLQFIWRDDASRLQLIGPYYEFGSSGASVNELHVVVRDVVRAFHCFGLQTHVIGCDGGAVNRAWMKQVLKDRIPLRNLLQSDGTHSTRSQCVDPSAHVERLISEHSELARSLRSRLSTCFSPHPIQPLSALLQHPEFADHNVAVTHLFDPDSLLFVIVDPTHQMKSLRNQLFGNSNSHRLCVYL